MGIYNAKVGKKYYTANYYDGQLEFNIYEVEKNDDKALTLHCKDENYSYMFIKRLHTEKYVEKTYAPTKKKAIEKLIQYYEFSVDELLKDINWLQNYHKDM